MPTKRQRRTKQHQGGLVTPAAVEAYRQGDVLRLQHELRLRPWDHSPIEPEGEALIAAPLGFDAEASRQRALRLRKEMEHAE